MRKYLVTLLACILIACGSESPSIDISTEPIEPVSEDSTTTSTSTTTTTSPLTTTIFTTTVTTSLAPIVSGNRFLKLIIRKR